MIVWRGWGLLVLLVPLVLFIAALVGVATLYNTGPIAPAQSDFQFAMVGAATLALSAAIFWPFSNYRERVAPDVDHFMYISTKYWVYLFLAGAVGVCGWAFIAPNV